MPLADSHRLHRGSRTANNPESYEFNLISDLTTCENIEFPLRLNRIPRPERTRRVDVLIVRLHAGVARECFSRSLLDHQDPRIRIERIGPNYE